MADVGGLSGAQWSNASGTAQATGTVESRGLSCLSLDNSGRGSGQNHVALVPRTIPSNTARRRAAPTA